MDTSARARCASDPELLLRALSEHLGVALWTTDRSLRLAALFDESRCGRSIPGRGRGTSRPREVLEEAHRQALAGCHVTFSFEREGRTFEALVGPLRDGKCLVGTLGIAVDVTRPSRSPRRRRGLDRRR